MKLLVFYRQKAEHTRRVEQYLHDLGTSHDVDESDVTVIDPDTEAGSSSAVLYDIVSFPGLVVTSNDGRYIQSWSGELPLMDELMGYMFS